MLEEQGVDLLGGLKSVGKCYVPSHLFCGWELSP